MKVFCTLHWLADLEGMVLELTTRLLVYAAARILAVAVLVGRRRGARHYSERAVLRL
jgi:hypothetical protein